MGKVTYSKEQNLSFVLKESVTFGSNRNIEVQTQSQNSGLNSPKDNTSTVVEASHQPTHSQTTSEQSPKYCIYVTITFCVLAVVFGAVAIAYIYTGSNRNEETSMPTNIDNLRQNQTLQRTQSANSEITSNPTSTSFTTTSLTLKPDILHGIAYKEHFPMIDINITDIQDFYGVSNKTEKIRIFSLLKEKGLLPTVQGSLSFPPWDFKAAGPLFLQDGKNLTVTIYSSPTVIQFFQPILSWLINCTSLIMDVSGFKDSCTLSDPSAYQHVPKQLRFTKLKELKIRGMNDCFFTKMFRTMSFHSDFPINFTACFLDPNSGYSNEVLDMVFPGQIKFHSDKAKIKFTCNNFTLI